MSSRSKCVLGYTGQPCSSSSANWYDTRIGGVPVWPEHPVPIIPPCPRCNASRFLILQAFAPHVTHAHRFILVFACNNIRCSTNPDSWLAIRVVHFCDQDKEDSYDHAKMESEANQAAIISEIDWDRKDETQGFSSDENIFDDSDDDSVDLADDLQSLSIQLDQARSKEQRRKQIQNKIQEEFPKTSNNNNKSNKHSSPNSVSSFDANQRNTFPSFYVDVEDEPTHESTSNLVDDASVNSLLQTYLENERKLSDNVNESWNAETEDESTEKENAFQHFQTIIERSPSQILRYAFGSTSHPIWPSAPSPSLSTTTCTFCHAPLVFELQIMASCLYYLTPDKHLRDGQKDAGLNFATAAIFTCPNDCAPKHNQQSAIPYQTKTFRAYEMAVGVMQDDW